MAKRKSFNRKYGLFEILIELVLLIIIIPFIFDLSLFTGIAYLIALGSSVLTGLFFRKRKMARFLVIGTALGYVAGLIFMDTFQNYKEFDPVSLGIMVFLIIMVWYSAALMKEGKKLNVKTRFF